MTIEVWSARWRFKPVTIFDVAVHKSKTLDRTPGLPSALIALEPEKGLTGEDFDYFGLPMIGGCQGCGAVIAAYNAHPSQTGFLLCRDCVGTRGFPSVGVYLAWDALRGEMEKLEESLCSCCSARMAVVGHQMCEPCQAEYDADEAANG